MKKIYLAFSLLLANLLLALNLQAQIIDYATQVSPIFAASCATPGCHVAGHFTGINLSSYDNALNSVGTGACGGEPIIAGNAVGSNLVTKIDASVPLCGGSAMPFGPPLSAAQITTIRNWIDQGAAPSDPTAPTYYGNFVQPIFTSNCAFIGCHTSAHFTNVDLTSQIAATSSIGINCGLTVIPGNAPGSPIISKIDPNIAVCTGGSMPPGNPGLPRAQVTTIAAWINSFATLPVSIVGFEARYNISLELVELFWQGPENVSVETYEVERSADGIDFQGIGSVDGIEDPAGLPYNWEDVRPMGGTLYYRIQYQDPGGDIQYSDIVQITVPNALERVALYPNPASDLFHLDLTLPAASHIGIAITNLYGNTVYKRNTWLDNGVTTMTIETKGWSSGIYFVRLSQAGIPEGTLKLVID